MPDRIPLGNDFSHAKLTPEKVVEMRRLHREGWTCKQLGAQFGIAASSAHAAITGKSWAHVPMGP